MQKSHGFHWVHQALAWPLTLMEKARQWKRGLSAGILVALATGLLLPAVGGTLMMWQVRQNQAHTLRQQILDNKEEVLARVLVEPLWNFDMDGLTTVANTAMLDPEVISFRVLDLSGNPLLDLRAPPRALDHQQALKRNILRGNTVIGQFQIVLDDSMHQQELRRDRVVFLGVLLGQFAGGMVLVFLALRQRVLTPVRHLTQFSRELAAGHLDTPFRVTGHDEIAQLGQQLEQMRDDLLAAFTTDQLAALDPAQLATLNDVIGVLELRMAVETEMAAIGCKPDITLEIDGVAAILDLVAEGMGYAILPRHALSTSSRPEIFQTHPIAQNRLVSRLALATAAGRTTTMTQQAMIELIQQVAHEVFGSPTASPDNAPAAAPYSTQA